MRHKSFTILALLFSVGVACAAWAAAEPTTPTIDAPKLQYVQGSAGLGNRNGGELEGYRNLWAHPGYANNTWVITIRRTTDLRGVLVDPTWDTTWSVSTNGTFYTTPNNPGCYDHGANFHALNWQDYGTAGSFNLEWWLQGKVATPGYYTCEFKYGTATYTMGRWYNRPPAETRSVRLRLTTTAGAAVPGVTCAVVPGRPVVAGEGLGVTGSTGAIDVQMAPGKYELEWTGGGITSFRNIVRITDLPWDSLQERVVQVGGNGMVPIDVRVVDATSKTPIKGASVVSAQNTHGQVTGSDGMVTFYSPAGGYFGVTVSKTGYTTQSPAAQQVANNHTNAIIVNLVRTSTWEPDPPDEDPGEAGGETGAGTDMGPMLSQEWWGNLFEFLFKPNDTTLQGWRTWWGSVTNWGPFGAVTTFWSEWNNGARSGVQGLRLQGGFNLFGDAGGAAAGWVDLRPARNLPLPEYEGGGRGSVAGNVLALVRTVSGYLVWVLWFLGLYKWLRPRLSI